MNWIQCAKTINTTELELVWIVLKWILEKQCVLTKQRVDVRHTYSIPPTKNVMTAHNQVH
jgi:hypothetical protein